MKKILFTLIGGLMISFSSLAQSNTEGHNLTFFTDGGEKFFVVLDGKRFNSKPDARVEVKGYKESSVRVKIFFVDEKWGSLNDERTLEGVEPGWNNFTYRIRKKTRRKKEFMDMSLDKWEPQDPKVKEAMRNEVKKEMEKLEEYQNPVTISDPVVVNPTTNKPKPIPVLKETEVQSVQPIGSSTPMKDDLFNRQMASLDKKPFENEKVTQALGIVKNNNLSLAQVKELLSKFAFEDNKLKVAKAAFSRCTEKDAYFEIADEFSFSTNKSALMEFINK